MQAIKPLANIRKKGLKPVVHVEANSGADKILYWRKK
jgi:hypothetical protein